MKRFIIRLLSLLGFAAPTGCGDDTGNMYGCPPAVYEIKGAYVGAILDKVEK